MPWVMSRKCNKPQVKGNMHVYKGRHTQPLPLILPMLCLPTTNQHTHTHTKLCPLVTVQIPFNNLHLAQTEVVVEGWRMKREGGISWGSSWLAAGPQNCRIIGMQRWMWHRPQCTEGGRTGVVPFIKPQSLWRGCGAVVEKYKGESWGTDYPPEREHSSVSLRLTWPHF